MLVPNLSQCLVDANSLATGQNTVSELQLRVERPLEQAEPGRISSTAWPMAGSLASGNVRTMETDCTEKEIPLPLGADGSVSYTFTQLNLFQEFGQTLFKWTPQVSICNQFQDCAYETCTWMPLPRFKEPAPPASHSTILTVL